MKAIIRNNRVVDRVQNSSTHANALPININWSIPVPRIMYHATNYVHEILDYEVNETRKVEPYPVEHCKDVIKEELRVQRVVGLNAGFEYDGDEFHSDSDSLTMIKLLPDSVPAFKHKNGWVPLPDTTDIKLAVDDHVQGWYGWEVTKSMEVNALTTFDELVEYYNVLTEQ